MIPVISDPESLSTPSDSSHETDAVFDLLADRRRRAILRYLEDFDAPVSLSDLADHVTLVERDPNCERSTIADWGDALLGTRRRVQISLRHVHLPKLAAADAVEFDLEANTVSLREAGTDLLARVESNDDGADEADGFDLQSEAADVPAYSPIDG